MAISSSKPQRTITELLLSLFTCVIIICCVGLFALATREIERSAVFQDLQHANQKQVPSVAGATEYRKNSKVIVYPDPTKTPGSVFPNVTKADICVSGYSATVRSVSESQKKGIFESYGVQLPVKPGEYEVDHFISLQLGGTNNDDNLWPEPAEPRPGFHEKDIVENYLKKLVCDGNISLREAQDRIKSDWHKEYLNWLEMKHQQENKNDDEG
jgi:hypothetical protein